MFLPIYQPKKTLQPSDYAHQMHEALIAIRCNSMNGPKYAMYRKAVAMDVMNIPNFIRIDDDYETSCPSELSSAFLDILFKTFKKIADNSEDGMLCGILANHAHNIPLCIIKKDKGPMTYWSLGYYWNAERESLLEDLKGDNNEKKEYGPDWYKLFGKEWKVISAAYDDGNKEKFEEMLNKTSSNNIKVKVEVKKESAYDEDTDNDDDDGPPKKKAATTNNTGL